MVQVALPTGSLTAKQHGELLTAMKGYNPIVGTHALIQDGAGVCQSWSAITDEQHRFGVKSSVSNFVKRRTS